MVGLSSPHLILYCELIVKVREVSIKYAWCIYTEHGTNIKVGLEQKIAF